MPSNPQAQEEPSPAHTFDRILADSSPPLAPNSRGSGTFVQVLTGQSDFSHLARESTALRSSLWHLRRVQRSSGGVP